MILTKVGDQFRRIILWMLSPLAIALSGCPGTFPTVDAPLAAAPTVDCAADADCDDSNACTADACRSGACESVWACDDGDACTDDWCDWGCHSAEIDCDDGDPCTDDWCDAATGCGGAPVECPAGEKCAPSTGGCVAESTAWNAGRPVKCDPSLIPTTARATGPASYAYWFVPEGLGLRPFYNAGTIIEQRIKLLQLAPWSFHAMQFFGEEGGSTGYIGLQTHGLNDDGTPTINLRFSIWNAPEAQGVECVTFGGEGVGKTCIISPYELDLDMFYTIRVERLEEGGGTWWKGTVKNEDTGEVSVIGKIRGVPGSQVGTSLNFSEYFGPRVVDSAGNYDYNKSVLQSIVMWLPPEITKDGQTIANEFSDFASNFPTGLVPDGASGAIVPFDDYTAYVMTHGSIRVCVP